jgi:hypothetical protein
VQPTTTEIAGQSLTAEDAAAALAITGESLLIVLLQGLKQQTFSSV